MKKRIEIEQAENGHTITVWESKEDDMYPEPTKHVATSDEEVLEIVKEHL
jgi:hypothetical protein